MKIFKADYYFGYIDSYDQKEFLSKLLETFDDYWCYPIIMYYDEYEADKVDELNISILYPSLNECLQTDFNGHSILGTRVQEFELDEDQVKQLIFQLSVPKAKPINTLYYYLNYNSGEMKEFKLKAFV